jgi:hypothetical protein
MSAKKTARIFSAFLCAVLLCVSICSTVYVVKNLNHPHNFGETRHTCHTCRQIQVVQAVLETIGSGLIPVAACMVAATTLIKSISLVAWEILVLSPVTLKIRLNN